MRQPGWKKPWATRFIVKAWRCARDPKPGEARAPFAFYQFKSDERRQAWINMAREVETERSEAAGTRSDEHRSSLLKTVSFIASRPTPNAVDRTPPVASRPWGRYSRRS